MIRGQLMSNTKVKKADIFISYRREGGEDAAVQILDALREIGYDVFLDFDSLRVGAFDEQLTATYDPQKGRLLNRSMLYENVQESTD